MKLLKSLILTLNVTFVLSATATAADKRYNSLEDFCNSTSADTPENCACGQVKADELLTPDEQQLVIGLMSQDPTAMNAFAELGVQGQVLMEKVEQITRGCN